MSIGEGITLENGLVAYKFGSNENGELWIDENGNIFECDREFNYYASMGQIKIDTVMPDRLKSGKAHQSAYYRWAKWIRDICAQSDTVLCSV